MIVTYVKAVAQFETFLADRQDAGMRPHPSCTARMGVDRMAVVDPRTMAVHGTTGLRVVDASAMPYITNGNIYAPVMMLAEKGADLILGRTPLAPEPIGFYRHPPTKNAPSGAGEMSNQGYQRRA